MSKSGVIFIILTFNLKFNNAQKYLSLYKEFVQLQESLITILIYNEFKQIVDYINKPQP